METVGIRAGPLQILSVQYSGIRGKLNGGLKGEQRI